MAEGKRVHAVHPGTILKEQLEARGVSAAAFALRLRVPPQRIQEIVAGKRAVTPERRCGSAPRLAPVRGFGWPSSKLMIFTRSRPSSAPRSEPKSALPRDWISNHKRSYRRS
jgi:hypothetical protein